MTAIAASRRSVLNENGSGALMDTPSRYSG